MNPFAQAPVFVDSGPASLIDFNQYQTEYYQQAGYVDQTPKTPIRTPVMGTRTFQHRRTLSNVSSQYSSRGGHVDCSEMIDPHELDYRFHNFNIAGEKPPPSQFHSVPYSCNHPDTTNAHSIPNRMQLYENVSHFQHQLHESSPAQQQHTPLKTSHIETSSHAQEYGQEYSKPASMTNSMRREMFFNPDPAPSSPKVTQSNGGDSHIATSYSTTKISGSTGCTPTHSTPQDSFSDDSSYLSALSSQNRVRFSPDNFLTDNTAFSPTSRIAVANLQRAMVRRTLELEEGEKS